MKKNVQNLDQILPQLKSITLESQGLNKISAFGIGKDAVLKALEQLGYIQIDTLSVIERAHHHTLWTRIPDYKSDYLNQLIQEGSIFEYWFHAASYLSMRDFRYALPNMLRIKRGESRYYNSNPEVLKYVYDTIRLEGAKKVRDFENPPKKSGSWWNWKPAKLALEQLFMQGDIMVCGRNGMEKVYDLTERVLPKSVNITEPTPWEMAEHLVKTNLKAYGFTTIKQITHLRPGEKLKINVQKVLDSMIEEKNVQQIKIPDTNPIFVLNTLLENPPSKTTSQLHILSPFDNAIIHRERIKQFFDFDFRLECYTPLEKRQFGYFCLPILWGDVFIGRVDCKAHRKTSQFELIHLHIENQQVDIELWWESFVKTMERFATFNECSSIKLSKVSPDDLTYKLKYSFEK